MEVVVEDKQLSLAIGKKGQNVRLAAKLTGWRIDIKSEEEKRARGRGAVRRRSRSARRDAEAAADEAAEPATSTADARRPSAGDAGRRRRPKQPQAPTRSTRRRDAAAAADDAADGGTARGRGDGRRSEPRAHGGSDDASSSRDVEVTSWQLFGFTRSRSCSARRARK